MSNSGQAESLPQTCIGSEQWIERVYDDLHRLAQRYMRGEPDTVSLSPTILIHELYLKLPANKPMTRAHFFAVAAKSMRHILVDLARHRSRLKRGGAYARQYLQDWDAVSIDNDEQVLAIDEAVQELSKLDERQARIVELRFFAGMSVADVAEYLNVSKRTVEADWTMAKAWLRRWLDSGGPAD